MEGNSASIIKPAALQTVALSVTICTIFECPTSIITSLISLAIKSLSLISFEQSMAFKNIDPLSVTTIKLIRDLLCESLYPSLTMLTPFWLHAFLIGCNNFSTCLLSF
ncbi:hypothetical protein AAZV13_10G064550 [Glycine max]